MRAFDKVKVSIYQLSDRIIRRHTHTLTYQHRQLLLRPGLVRRAEQVLVFGRDGRRPRGQAGEVGHEDVLAEGGVPRVERWVLLVEGVDFGLEVAGGMRIVF